MAKNQQDGNVWICNVCKEEYTGKSRKWTCPICGTADSFEKAVTFDDEEFEDEEY